MPSVPIAIFMCSRGRRREPCSVAGCTSPYVALCDFPLAGPKAGKTCDRRMCEQHRTRMPGKDRDFCPVHARLEPALFPSKGSP